jgi:hypothetical protein
MKRATTAVTALTFVAAAAAWAGVGDVLSSFSWSGSMRGIYRDGAYVYGVHQYTYEPAELFIFTPSGSMLPSSARLPGLNAAGDADHSSLGADYVAVMDGTTLLREYVITTGSFVRSTAASGMTGYAYIPGSGYMYFANGTRVYRYTTAGSLVGSFPIPGGYIGGIAATAKYGGLSGEYVVVAVWAWRHDTDEVFVYNSNGSVAGTFSVPGTTYGCVCGPGYPSSANATFWCNLYTGVTRWAYQISLGNGVAVEPTSLGKVKALFR